LDDRFTGKRILLIDKDSKTKNDRTWSFWSKEEELFESILHKTWREIEFANGEFKQRYDIAPYSYKMIRGLDFYNHVIPKLKKEKNIDFIIGDIQEIRDEDSKVILKTSNNSYEAKYAFKSFHDKIDFSSSHFVWQHFKGWVIKTETPVFEADVAMFMDFRVRQENDTRFFYVLPFSEKEALIEIAVFSSTIPDPSYYDPIIKDYIKNKLKIERYNILEEEVGAIPMTSYDFKQDTQKRIINIGTNAGSVQASSGFAFKRIQKETDKLAEYILSDKIEKYQSKDNRYSLYDNTLLNAITTGKTSGAEVFGKLFKKLSPQSVFKFLDHEGGLLHDFKIFTAPPMLPFLKAFLEELPKR